MGYTGSKTQQLAKDYGVELEIVKRPRTGFWSPDDVDLTQYCKQHNIDTSTGFKLQPKRWVVERTFAWFNKFRRLSKDYEYLIQTSEVMLTIAMTKILLTRLVMLDKV